MLMLGNVELGPEWITFPLGEGSSGGSGSCWKKSCVSQKSGVIGKAGLYFDFTFLFGNSHHLSCV